MDDFFQDCCSELFSGCLAGVSVSVFFCCFNLKLEAESEYLNRCYLLNLYLMLPTYTTSQRIYEVLDLNQAVMSKLLFLQYPYNPLL